MFFQELGLQAVPGNPDIVETRIQSLIRQVDTRRGGLAFGALMSIILSSCVTGGFNYYNFVTSSGADMYFKVPSSWADYGPSQVFGTTHVTLSQSQLTVIEAGNWANVFAASSAKSLAGLTGIFSKVPFGISQATKLTPSERDSFSNSSLRSLLLPVDPLLSSSSNSGVQYTSKGYSEFVTPNGMRGSKMVVEIKELGKPAAVLSQVAEVDSSTNWVYLIAVGCDLSCYNTNSSVINEIISSWSVRSS